MRSFYQVLPSKFYLKIEYAIKNSYYIYEILLAMDTIRMTIECLHSIDCSIVYTECILIRRSNKPFVIRIDNSSFELIFIHCSNETFVIRIKSPLGRTICITNSSFDCVSNDNRFLNFADCAHRYIRCSIENIIPKLHNNRMLLLRRNLPKYRIVVKKRKKKYLLQFRFCKILVTILHARLLFPRRCAQT